MNTRRNRRRRVLRLGSQQTSLTVEPLEARLALTSILFLGGQSTPTQGADGEVMSFLETTFGAECHLQIGERCEQHVGPR